MAVASRLFLVLPLMLSLAACASWEETPRETRTVNRDVVGDVFYPDFLTDKPEFYEFSPAVSNHDPQNQHPQQWAGQDWETSAWNKHWTPERAVKYFFANKVFHAQKDRSNFLLRNSDRGPISVLEVGPNFYKISDLDQRRSLKLYADYTEVFTRYKMIELRDWKTGQAIGAYTQRGMQLY